MFGLGTAEIVGIVLIVFLVYGPDKMPKMIKTVVGYMRQFKNMTDEVTNTVSREVHRIERDVTIDMPPLIDPKPTIPRSNTIYVEPSVKKDDDGTES